MKPFFVRFNIVKTCRKRYLISLFQSLWHFTSKNMIGKRSWNFLAEDKKKVQAKIARRPRIRIYHARLTQQMTSSFTLSAKYFLILSSPLFNFHFHLSLFRFSQKIPFLLLSGISSWRVSTWKGRRTTPNRIIQKISSFLTYNPYQNFLSFRRGWMRLLHWLKNVVKEGKRGVRRKKSIVSNY